MSNILLNAPDGSTFGPGQKVVIGPFIHTNLATTPLANGACPLGGVLPSPSTGPADWVAPFPGRIIAGSVQLGTAFLTTTGTLKYLIAVNGTTQASATKLVIQPSIGAGNLTKTAVAGNVDGTTAINFTRGQRIGIRMTSASTVNPATVEGYVTLVVEL